MGLDIYSSSDYFLPDNTFNVEDGSIVNLEIRLWLKNETPLGPGLSMNDFLSIPSKQLTPVKFEIIGNIFTPESYTRYVDGNIERKIIPLYSIENIIRILRRANERDNLHFGCLGRITPWIGINGVSYPCTIFQTEYSDITLYAQVHPSLDVISPYEKKMPRIVTHKK